MKFQKLIIKNIASFEDVAIDFDTEPLCSSEVFLITGKTGAGKSTILDAICLALYANTPRLVNTNMEGKTKEGDKDITIKDTRQLMRRNTGEASVTLTFVGSNQIPYLAEWSVARARNKPYGNIQNKKWSLTNLNTSTTLTKDDEIRAEMKMAIGLDFNQFCRTTLLAQGEFTRFLNSKDEDKASILEKITGVDTYSKIGRKVFELTSQRESLWNDAQRKVEGTRVLTSDEIAELQERQKNLITKYQEQKKIFEDAVKKRLWLETDADFTDKITKALQLHSAAVAVTDSEDFKWKAQLVRQWHETIKAREWLRNYCAAVSMVKKQQESLENMRTLFFRFKSGESYVAEELKNLQTELNELDAFIDAHKDIAAVYDKAQTITSSLGSITDGRLKIQLETESIEKEKELLNGTLKIGKDQADSDYTKIKSEFDTQSALLNTQEKALFKANLAELRKTKDNCQMAISDVNKAQYHHATFCNEKERTRLAKESLAQTLARIQDLYCKAKALDSPIAQSKGRMEALSDTLEQQRSTVDKWAKNIRAKLKEGDTCPVCRQQLVHSLPVEEELDQLFAKTEQSFKEAKLEYDTLVTQQNRLLSDAKSLQSQYDNAKKRLEEDKTLEVVSAKALEMCSKCGVNSLDDNVDSRLNELLSGHKDSLITIENHIKAAEELENGVNILRKHTEELRYKVEQSKEAVDSAAKRMADTNARIATSNQLILSKQQEVKEVESKVASLVDGYSWPCDWKNETQAFSVMLNKAAEQYTEKLRSQREKQIAVQESQTLLYNVRNAVAAITALTPQWQVDQPVLSFMIPNLLAELNDIRTRIQSANDQLITAQETVRINKESVDTYLHAHSELSEEKLLTLDQYSSERIQAKGQELDECKEAVLAKKTALDQLRSQQQEHAQKKPAFEEEESVESLSKQITCVEQQMNEIGEQKGAIDQQMRNDQENKRTLEALINDSNLKKAEYIKWSRLNQLLGDAKGNKFLKIAQSYVLSNLIYTANSYMKTLSDRYTLLVEPGTFVISIEDAYQGYARRAASTISGGESFLVSLSLALALSDIGQQLSVDTLFIDEGFGTLSGEPLQNAISTLRSLHTRSGRHVGIISHIDELRERIPVQINVEQEGNHSSSKVYVTPNVN